MIEDTSKGALEIRPYVPADRGRVRTVCFETGYMGDPVAWLWPDADSFADLFCGYYTDAEPGAASVVTIDGRVEGYLLGCVDSSAVWPPQSILGRHIVRRRLTLRPRMGRFLARGIVDAVGDIARKRVDLAQMEFHDPRYPAHLHIDLLPVARGRGAGARLVQGWLERLRAEGVPGCHLQTFAENTGGRAFFAAMGFRPVGDAQPVPGFRTPLGARLHTVTMVRDL